MTGRNHFWNRALWEESNFTDVTGDSVTWNCTRTSVGIWRLHFLLCLKQETTVDVQAALKETIASVWNRLRVWHRAEPNFSPSVRFFLLLGFTLNSSVFPPSLASFSSPSLVHLAAATHAINASPPARHTGRNTPHRLMEKDMSYCRCWAKSGREGGILEGGGGMRDRVEELRDISQVWQYSRISCSSR